MKRTRSVLSMLVVASALTGAYLAFAWTPIPVKQDPLVRMPGTQPEQGVNLEAPGRCLNCHAGYNPEVEPGFNWKGSMMAQAARDFLFWSCLTVAAQDSIWAVGTPNAVDICERCHFPKGWLENRSDPPNASAMTGADYDGVHCDFCHRMWDPFFETTYAGTREGDDWLNYWDETNASDTPSQPAADATYGEDMTLAAAIPSFNGQPFFANNLPPANYQESGSGQYFVSLGSQKRAPFADAAARHQMLYSRYNKSKFFCSTCHDVSNPVLANLGADPAQPLPTELNSAFSYYHVERTFSEFMLSAYGQPGGAATNQEFQDQGAPGITQAAMCQDCHMRDVVGMACNKKGVPIRPSESVEHPQSGQPLHDLTGGNAWVSLVLASAVPGSPNYDAVNDQLLNQGPGALTLDLTQGEGIDPVALLAGADRATQQLLLAASIKNLSYDSATGLLAFRVQNNTAHKLISGFPEGRRMFVNVKAYAGGSLVYEVNPYDNAAGTLKGLHYPYDDPNGVLPTPQAIDPAVEAYVDELVYEMHPESALTGETESFHFALATGRHKDNRIPPKGFRIAEADARLSVPVYYVDGVDVGAGYFTDAEYDGGYDEVNLADYGILIPGADYVEVNLYYQTTSREYVEFLRDEIKGTGNLTLSSPTPSGEPNAYVVQTDPFFAQLRAWGDTMWDLWTHNMNVESAAPFLMASASAGVPPVGCTAPTPTLLTATPGHSEVTLTWSDESADPMVAGYMVYYDQAGKAQFVASISDPIITTFTDTALTNGIEYCYKVTSYYDATCESAFSNILCAIPQSQGQATDPAGVSMLETGIYIGKGKAKTFQAQTAFNPGDAVVIRAYVLDGATGLPVADATVEMLITGPETLTLTTGPSDANGMAEAAWNTKAPGRRNPGTTPGTYTVETKNVNAAGYHWDGVTTSTTFSIQ
ncbi:MAG: fibronectin type III domain-containing protein [Phycisphaerales bacterium]|nr:MAG: fibronectin type III domain-containing protein [Phycisphaerales bacterium]